MTRDSRLAARVLWLALLAFAAACGESRAPSPESRAAGPGSRAPSVSLPDISSAAGPVQKQLRDAYALLLQNTSNPVDPAPKRATA